MLGSMTIELNPSKPEPQRLRCDNCREWLVLSIEDQIVGIEDVTLECLMPFLRCVNCGRVYVPGRSFGVLLRTFREAHERGQRRLKCALRLENVRAQRFSFCNNVPFKYDPVDYYYLPGLLRPTSSGSLTPVFFSRDVLVQYYNHPDYAVSFGSDTYGTIHTASGHMIAFGINRADKVIMWLGDIDRLPRAEQLYLASRNVDSDHDIGSEFYGAQIEIEFTEYSKEQLVIKKLSEFADEIFKRYKVKLLQLDSESLPIIKSLKPPIHFSEKEMGDSMEAFNKLLVERLNTSVLKQDLQTKLASEEVGRLQRFGGLKTLELWLQRRAGVSDAHSRISALFALYDLRVVFKHLTSEETRLRTLKSCCKRLGLEDGVTHKEMYSALLGQLATFYEDALS